MTPLHLTKVAIVITVFCVIVDLAVGNPGDEPMASLGAAVFIAAIFTGIYWAIA